MTSVMLLNLARLPPDIIRTIIRMSGEQAEEAVKLISRQWYAVATEKQPVNRADLPIIHWFCWHVDGFEDSNLYMRVADENRKHFGVTKWSKMWFQPENVHCRFVKDRTSRKANTEKKTRFYARTGRLLQKCSRIGKLELKMDLTEIGAEINVVKSAIKGIIIDELHLRGVQTLNDESVSVIFDLIQENQVKLLILSISDVRSIRRPYFIEQVLPFVSTLEFNDLLTGNEPKCPTTEMSVTVQWWDTANWLKERTEISSRFVEHGNNLRHIRIVVQAKD